MSSLDRQVGEGAYSAPYRDFAIQPAEFCEKNKLSWCQANVVKYVCRFRLKNGREDLAKARHYLDMLEEMEYGEAEAPKTPQPVGGWLGEKFVPAAGEAAQKPGQVYIVNS